MTKHIPMATMRCALIFLLIATFLAHEASAYASSSACSLINGQWVCQNNQNNGNGAAAGAISTGNDGDVYAGPLPAYNERQPIYNENNGPYNNMGGGLPPNNNGPFNNRPFVTGGAWAGAGAFPNNGLSMDEILRNPFRMLNFPPRPLPQRPVPQRPLPQDPVPQETEDDDEEE